MDSFDNELADFFNMPLDLELLSEAAIIFQSLYPGTR